MTEHGVIRGIEVALCAPPDQILQVVKIRVSIEPPSGALMIYGGPSFDAPVRVDGPGGEVEIPTKTHKVIFQLLDGAERYEHKTLGYLAQRPLEE